MAMAIKRTPPSWQVNWYTILNRHQALKHVRQLESAEEPEKYLAAMKKSATGKPPLALYK